LLTTPHALPWSLLVSLIVLTSLRIALLVNAHFAVFADKNAILFRIEWGFIKSKSSRIFIILFFDLFLLLFLIKYTLAFLLGEEIGSDEATRPVWYLSHVLAAILRQECLTHSTMGKVL
ncbi:hypothetical protein PENTCL1PPCAC_10928, partial [Pristionchus entomophagus]